MSLYNMINGFNPSCILFMPMLGRKQDEYPRFRDCFLSDDKERIIIYTRVGGGNRNEGYGEEELYKDPLFVRTYDSEYDSTYGYYEFNVPEKWKSDFDKIVNGKFQEVSDGYVDLVKSFYPKLTNSGMFDKIFRGQWKDNNDICYQVDCNNYNHTYTLEYQHMQFLDMQDIDLLKSFLSGTDYFITPGTQELYLFKSYDETFQRVDIGNYIIKTKSNNVFVVDKDTFNNMR